MIIDSSGRIISCDSGKAYRNIGISDNVYEFYVKNGEVSEKDMAEAKSNIQNQKAGILVLKDKNEVSYLAYDTLEMNDWMLCYIVPVKAAQKSYAFIQEYEMIFMLVFCVLVGILVIYIARKNNREKVKLLAVAQRDALTGLYNKDYTQKFIERILQQESGQHGFVILDVDYFKSVNDS